MSRLAAVRDELAATDPFALEGDAARIAFWVNAYNALVVAELGERPRQGSLLRHRKLFATEIARVGEHGYSLDQIEHGVLRLNARPPYRVRRPFGTGDPRIAASPSRLDPRAHFALNCGAVSCPAIRDYDAVGLEDQLERTTRAYLRAETELDRERNRLTLPYLMRLYRADFERPAEFAAERLDPDDAAWIRERSPRLGYGRFDWTLVEI